MKNRIAVLPALAFSLLFLYACEKQNAQIPAATATNPVTVTPPASAVQPLAPEAPLPRTLDHDKVIFESETHNFGTVKQNIPAKHRFVFTNQTGSDLVIETVKPSCQCTSSEYSKGPIKNGEKGYVDAEFNAKAPGVFRKSVTITTNAGIFILNLSGEVIASE